MDIELAFAVAILILLTFLACIDMAFSNLSDLSLRRLTSDSDETAKSSSIIFLKEIVENRPRFRFALSTAIQVLMVSFTVLAVLTISHFVTEHSHLIIYALITAILGTLLFRQLLPRLFVRNNPESKLLKMLPVVRPIYSLAAIITTPLASLFSRSDKPKVDLTTTPEQTAEERGDDNSDDFQALMEVGEAEGIIESTNREMIESMFEFSDTTADEIMTPRTEICSLPATATVKDARDLINEEKYSRLPVYRDSIDNIEGVIYVRDLLQAWADGRENVEIGEILRSAYFVPETKSAAELLRQMQTDHVQLAIVIDEYGGVAGIVTVEDILEEIVGEIEDEDTEEEEVIEIIAGNDGYWDVVGSTEIDKIERLLDLDLEDEEYNTIAGMVITETGHVPKEGETLQIKGLDIEIRQTDDKRIQMLRIKPSPDPTPEEPVETKEL